MHKIVLSMMFILGYLFMTPVFAAKIGVLDAEQLMNETGATNRAMNKISKRYASKVRLLEKEERVLQRTVNKYNKISDKLQPDEIKQWQHKINAEQDKLQQKRAILQEEIVKAEDAETNRIISSFFSIVTKIAEKNDLDLIMFKDVTAYNDIGKIKDITDEVIRRSTRK